MTTTEKKRIKDLLTKLVDHIQTERGFQGMCGSIMEMREYTHDLTNGEADILNEYIISKRQNQRYAPSPLYWWKPGNKKTRINWLNREIIKLTLDF